jgi:hypothetical protein
MKNLFLYYITHIGSNRYIHWDTDIQAPISIWMSSIELAKYCRVWDLNYANSIVACIHDCETIIFSNKAGFKQDYISLSELIRIYS